MDNQLNNKADFQEGKKFADRQEQRRNTVYLDLAAERIAPGMENIGSAHLILDAYGIVPPYLLEEMSKRDPLNGDNRKVLNKMLEMAKPNSQIPLSSISTNHFSLAVGKREIYDAHARFTHPGEKARFEGEKPTGDDEVDMAYDYAGIVRDFYAKEFDRNSIDGQSMKLMSTVNYGINFQNAYWNGSQMIYGRPGANSPFKTMVLLDICAHEFTHGITHYESKLNYYGQSGALNESLSDVFGSLIKQYSKKQTANQADWLIGQGIFKDSVSGRGFRDLLNPGTAYDDPLLGKDPQPAHMKDYVKMTGDNGGVHYNSGIPNRAFALFARAVGGYAWDAPGHIWFAARKAAGSNPSFAQFAYHTIEQAKILGHDAKVGKLEEAWKAVGIIPSATAKDIATPKEFVVKNTLVA